MERYELELLVQHIGYARAKIQSSLDCGSAALAEMDCNSALQALDFAENFIHDNLGTGDESRIFTDAAAHGYTVPAADPTDPIGWGSDGDWTRAAGTVGPWLFGVGLVGIVTCAILAMLM